MKIFEFQYLQCIYRKEILFPCPTYLAIVDTRHYIIQRNIYSSAKNRLKVTLNITLHLILIKNNLECQKFIIKARQKWFTYFFVSVFSCIHKYFNINSEYYRSWSLYGSGSQGILRRGWSPKCQLVRHRPHVHWSPPDRCRKLLLLFLWSCIFGR